MLMDTGFVIRQLDHIAGEAHPDGVLIPGRIIRPGPLPRRPISCRTHWLCGCLHLRGVKQQAR